MTALNSWALLDYCYTHWDTGLVIVTATNYPCHLTAYISDQHPLKHSLTRILRGLKTPWGTYHCFVTKEGIDQSEAGDTLTHTFRIDSWPALTTWWWVLKGTIGGLDSPSMSPPIEHYHPGGFPEYLTIRPNNPGDYATIWATTPPNQPHYLMVDDIIPDEDATMVRMTLIATSTRSDLYNMQTVNPQAAPFSNVTFYARWRRSGGFAYAIKFWLLFQTHATVYTSPPHSNPGIYENKSWSHDTNPFTLLPWTLTEINNLQAGITLQTYLGVGWASLGYCTQTYAIVRRGLCTPTPAPGPYP